MQVGGSFRYRLASRESWAQGAGFGSGLVGGGFGAGFGVFLLVLAGMFIYQGLNAVQ